MENMQVAPREGMALLHIHGDKCMLHEARNVTKGIKYILRSDVAFAWSAINPDARFWDQIYVFTSHLWVRTNQGEIMYAQIYQ